MSTFFCLQVGAENMLVNGSQDLLHGLTFVEKFCLLAQYTPVMALTAIFRVGSSSIVLYHPAFLQPLHPTASIFLTWTFFVVSVPLSILLLTLLKPWSQKLR